jgi:dynein intermediate chain 1
MKKKNETDMLYSINASIIQQFGKAPLSDDPIAQKRSLRNQFNYQERAAQTFNLPLREKGMKTDPPQRSVFAVEATQWMIFDAYMAAFEKMQREEAEEAAKGKKGEKKPA